MPTCSRIRSLFKVCKCNSPVLEALELTLQTLHRAGMAGGCKFAVWYSPADRVSETLKGWVKSVQVSGNTCSDPLAWGERNSKSCCQSCCR